MQKILILGLPFFTKKYQYVIDAYKSININPLILINSNNKESGQNNIINAGNNKFIQLFNFIKVLIWFKPKNIDCYDYSILTILYIIISKLAKSNTRIWLIGSELKGDFESLNKINFTIKTKVHIKRKLTILSLFVADTIFAKELHHIESIERINKNLLKKTIKIYNCVPIPDHISNNFKNKNDFIFANAVIKQRNVIDLIKSFDDLAIKKINFKAKIYGFNSIDNEIYSSRGMIYSKKALDYFHTKNLKNHVSVYGFTKNVIEQIKESKFFILPGEVILANYSLLEAMSHGIIPIVYPGNGYEKIITDGYNGIVAKNNNLTQALIEALSIDEKRYNTMSINAFRTIKDKFSLEQWANTLKTGLK